MRREGGEGEGRETDCFGDGSGRPEVYLESRAGMDEVEAEVEGGLSSPSLEESVPMNRRRRFAGLGFFGAGDLELDGADWDEGECDR